MYQDQEPLRCLGWIANAKDIKEIFLTTDLQDVSGGSICFSIEAAYFGFTDEYVYSGSSSPMTGWLPSYDLGEAVALKSKLDKIAVKTLAGDLDNCEEAGLQVVTRYENNGSLPARVAVESSVWFFEMLLDEKAIYPVQVEPKIVEV